MICVLETYRSGRTGTHSKCVCRVIGTRVRISPSPPHKTNLNCIFRFFYLGVAESLWLAQWLLRNPIRTWRSLFSASTRSLICHFVTAPNLSVSAIKISTLCVLFFDGLKDSADFVCLWFHHSELSTECTRDPVYFVSTRELTLCLMRISPSPPIVT